MSEMTDGVTSVNELEKIKRGAEAWKRHKNDQTWNDWCEIHEALEIGKIHCMGLANTTTPNGKGYVIEYGKWLKKYGFDDIDKGVRSRLAQCMEKRSEIERMRSIMSLSERLKLNHPNSVWRKFVASTGTGKSNSRAKPAVSKDAEIKRLEGEIERIKANGGDLFDLNKSSPADIARVLFEHLPEYKFDQLIRQCVRLQGIQKEKINEHLDQLRADAKKQALHIG